MTLIDSRPVILGSWRGVGEDTGVPIDLAEVDRRLGIKLEDEAGHWFPPDQIEPAVASYIRHYDRLAPDLTRTLPGAQTALDAVRAAGRAPVLITAKRDSPVTAALALTGLRVAGVHTRVHGPEKAAVLARIGAVAYVGDTPPDVEAARTAGAAAVGVSTGSFTAAELAAAGADVVLGSLEEFPGWLARQ